ncbi:hypothetical protein Bca4012_005318 [Brassica carinata]|uniref:BnaC03g48720D protein n=3 Tax=Brassica TaxID=3705 RepID=A0A078HIA5_BRANA|nr:PREDICTED: uncharacterized protein LOC106335264 [Brassica oleracea var. oleracea]XP_013641460.1 uncharacterized protein BNAC03G48720D [Brassica napus]VDC94893.1 unnamed protein product [Brassica oleracea]KAH0892322.1 hypothetical protein HID58_054751 [Brassica napus]CAF1706754.1 unnamed protein product [Brassica napus]CDY36513.1 BnaC03g48720D [Brassica napus]
MAWLARSIANSLKLDEDDGDDEKRLSGEDSVPNQSVSESQSPRGVKEDISELTKTLRSQFWGVASFLSQPSSSPDLQERNQSPDHAEEEDEDLIAGIRNDFAEIGGRFRTGISKLSENLPVSDFTKIASNFLQLGSEGADPKDYGDIIGVTEELVAFVRDLAMHPETWLDLPLPDEDDTFDEFEMTDDQHEHAMAVERLVPSLSSLRIELCPEYMSENCFWMIYFVLLHPKLTQHDASLLSTPQVLEARAMLSHELQKINRAPVEGESSEANAAVVEPLTVNPQEFETDKHTVESKEIQVVDKSVIEERNSSTDSSSSSRFVNVQAEDEEEEEEDADDWLNDEESSDAVSGMEGGATTKHPLGEEDEEDVSFSDLEDDDEERDVQVSSKRSTNSSSPDWVQI